MSSWDWIQWWYVGWMVLSVGIALLMQGKPKVGHYDFRYTFISLLICMPSCGRILGWW